MTLAEITQEAQRLHREAEQLLRTQKPEGAYRFELVTAVSELGMAAQSFAKAEKRAPRSEVRPC